MKIMKNHIMKIYKKVKELEHRQRTFFIVFTVDLEQVLVERQFSFTVMNHAKKYFLTQFNG